MRRGGETDTEQSEAGHGRGGKKEGKETWRVIERGAGEGAVSKPAASQPIKSPEWEEGARETASAQALGRGKKPRFGGTEGTERVFRS